MDGEGSADCLVKMMGMGLTVCFTWMGQGSWVVLVLAR
jgi:hypothetical protein